MTVDVKPSITGTTHSVVSDGLRLHVWEKRASSASAAAGTHAVLLVHGATYGGERPFDIQVPGRDYSLMDYLATRGMDVFTFDIRGYGRSEKPAEGHDVLTESAVADIGAVVEFICAERGVEQVDVLGWSWGSLSSSLYASAHPERVRRLVMYAGGPQSRTRNQTPADEIPAWTFSTREMIVARIEQDAVLEDAQEWFIAQALEHDAQSPNGFRRATALGVSPKPDPTQLKVPTLLIYGARDSAYDATNASSFFAQIANDDKELVIVPDSGHFLIFQKQRMRLFEAAERWFRGSSA